MDNEKLERANQIHKDIKMVRRAITFLIGSDSDIADRSAVEPYIAELLPPGMVETFTNATMVQLNVLLVDLEQEFKAL